jgi:hypothetical protein
MSKKGRYLLTAVEWFIRLGFGAVCIIILYGLLKVFDIIY